MQDISTKPCKGSARREVRVLFCTLESEAKAVKPGDCNNIRSVNVATLDDLHVTFPGDVYIYVDMHEGGVWELVETEENLAKIKDKSILKIIATPTGFGQPSAIDNALVKEIEEVLHVTKEVLALCTKRMFQPPPEQQEQQEPDFVGAGGSQAESVSPGGSPAKSACLGGSKADWEEAVPAAKNLGVHVEQFQKTAEKGQQDLPEKFLWVGKEDDLVNCERGVELLNSRVCSEASTAVAVSASAQTADSFKNLRAEEEEPEEGGGWGDDVALRRRFELASADYTMAMRGVHELFGEGALPTLAAHLPFLDSLLLTVSGGRVGLPNALREEMRAEDIRASHRALHSTDLC